MVVARDHVLRAEVHQRRDRGALQRLQEPRVAARHAVGGQRLRPEQDGADDEGADDSVAHRHSSVIVPSLPARHSPGDQAVAHRRSSLARRRVLPVLRDLVSVRHRDDVLGLPEVSPADRLERSPALDPATVRVSPAQAVDALGQSHPPEQIRLNSFDGRPVYRIRVGRAEQIVYADTGTPRGDVSRDVMARVASAWAGQPAAAATVEPIDVDQWTVQGSFRSLRPLWKYSWPVGNRSMCRRSPEKSCSTPRGPRAWAPTWDRFRTGCISRRSANTSSPGVASSSGRRVSGPPPR